jgi:hypothetical protein
LPKITGEKPRLLLLIGADFRVMVTIDPRQGLPAVAGRMNQSISLRVQHLRAVIQRFRNGADEATTQYFRELMADTAAELEAAAAALEANEPGAATG